jgi:hypothetical protein
MQSENEDKVAHVPKPQAVAAYGGVDVSYRTLTLTLQNTNCQIQSGPLCP